MAAQRFNFMSTLVLAVLLSSRAAVQAQQFFDSGSNGSDGALNLTTPGVIEFDPATFNPPLDPDGDNVYHFTTITIGAGVTVRLTSRKINAPVFWLTTKEVQIDGTIDLNGENGIAVGSTFESRLRAMPGAGGYAGGVAAFGSSPAEPGEGPGGGRAGTFGGGGGYAGVGGCNGGAAYGNDFLVPLLGGSGGGGNNQGGGGAGGGALLIASSQSIAVTGTVRANGGHIGSSFSGGGSGGAIRLAAPLINGGGFLLAEPGGANCPGSNGRIRLEAFQNQMTRGASPQAVLALPYGVFLPASQPPSVRVVSIDGKPVLPSPTASLTLPDVVLNKATPVTVNIEAHHIPPGTIVKLLLFSDQGATQSIDSTPLVGTEATSTATATITVPLGYSRGYVRATWTAP